MNTIRDFLLSADGMTMSAVLEHLRRDGHYPHIVAMEFGRLQTEGWLWLDDKQIIRRNNPGINPA